jgi:hypothetical protein
MVRIQAQDGAEKWAAFFETRRYGAYLGATTEFSKWEGLTFSPSRSKIYTAITDGEWAAEDNLAHAQDAEAAQAVCCDGLQ